MIEASLNIIVGVYPDRCIESIDSLRKFIYFFLRVSLFAVKTRLT